MKKILFYFFCACLSTPGFAQNPTPDSFLGYPLGSRFTFHATILDYVKTLAEKNPSKVKLIPYGSTYEGRPLMVAVVASPENLARLETIRTDNLKSIGLLEGSPSDKVPALAWLSYNVHGNEAVSSEAVMRVMYELLNTENTTTQEILKNTVVILDPCINPDGRERYTQWYTRVMAQSTPNATPWAWEHNEPWPGGRFNHYLFDLNRDWAWQLQKESQERIQLYNQWMPHLHADFHEMGSASSYYFPPASKPFHKDITPWQREFNGILGEYSRKYFDKNSWLYFTRNNYDLFYPSYGDTWPTYNGAIGMTYEQGGGGRAGAAIARENENDTLTLYARIDHHFATSMSTLESISSRADKTVQEFVKYHVKAQNDPIGAFKSYLVKSSGNEGRVHALIDLLKKQGIQYGLAGKTFSSKATNLGTLSEENVKFEENDLLISAFQTKSTLLKILFEAQPDLEDSVTYDITSWGLAYAYGLTAYGLKDKMTPAAYRETVVDNPIPAQAPYAYVANWNSLADLRFLTDLFAKNIRLRTSNVAFEMNGKTFAAGTLVITRKGNEALNQNFDRIVTEAATKYQIQLTPAVTGFVTKGSDFGSGDVVPLTAPKVAVVGGNGVSPLALGEVWHFFEQQINYPLTVVEGDMLGYLPWDELDVLILPTGNYGRILSEGTMNQLKTWIRGGGKLIAMEQSLNAFADKPEFALKRKKSDDKKDKEAPFALFGNREREAASDDTPGSIYELKLDSTHPLAFGYNGKYFGLIRSAYNFDYLSDGWNVGYLEKDGYRAGFVGQNAKEKLKNTLIYGVQEMGRGQVIFMADNPLFRGFWYNGKVIFGNAVFR
ncbi:M14 family zinc carboxypeptidase [Arundinibacter roseus]|uniref:Zinc carboxypeptidase n=1 Tax=Arundinibacter roseus TaxID=2070510 RepID=A0A4R4K9G2_9BACT|nr:M14 family zinc carboxypeptidase [Arundinibacter roseus]TDB64427.1 zinc carboxypeptidase [Arundinibacter roseus]